MFEVTTYTLQVVFLLKIVISTSQNPNYNMNDITVFIYCPSSLSSVFSVSLSFPHCSSSQMGTRLICHIWSTVSALDRPRQAAHV